MCLMKKMEGRKRYRRQGRADKAVGGAAPEGSPRERGLISIGREATPPLHTPPRSNTCPLSPLYSTLPQPRKHHPPKPCPAPFHFPLRKHPPCSAAVAHFSSFCLRLRSLSFLLYQVRVKLLVTEQVIVKLYISGLSALGLPSNIS